MPQLEITPEERTVRLNGEVLVLGARAFDVLRLLHENSGEVVSKQTLLEEVWGGLAVEEGNLTVQVSTLRKALGTDAIRTVPGIGYLLSGQSASSVEDGPAVPTVPSVAVLPFANLTGDTARDYYVDGVATDLIATLSRIRGLFVIAATSSFRFKGQSVDLRDVGRELGVRYLLEGAVQQAGDALRVTVQLVVAETGHTIWSDRVTGSLDDIFDVQDALAEKVSTAIEPTLLTAETARAMAKPTDSQEAYDLFLQATSLLNGIPDVHAFENSVSLLDRALEMDPGFDRAKAWKCRAFMMARASRLITFERAMSVFDLAEEIIGRDQDDPYVLVFAGLTHGFLAKNKEPGAQAARRAISMAPHSCVIMNTAAWPLTYVSDYDAAIECFEKSLRLDPIGPLSYYGRAGYGAALLFSGRLAEAITVLEDCRATSPGFGSVLQWLTMAYWKAGRVDDARDAAAALKAVVPDIGLAMTIEGTPHKQPEQLDLLEAVFRGVGLPE